jgi:hypothetical protein
VVEAVARSEGARLRAALGTIDALIKTREHGALAARVAELERPVGPVPEELSAGAIWGLSRNRCLGTPAEPDEAPDFSGLGTGNFPAKGSIQESSGIATEKEPSTAVSISQGIAPRWHLRAASLVLGLIRGRRSARILGAAP